MTQIYNDHFVVSESKGSSIENEYSIFENGLYFQIGINEFDHYNIKWVTAKNPLNSQSIQIIKSW